MIVRPQQHWLRRIFVCTAQYYPRYHRAYYSIFSFLCCYFHAALVHASGHQIHPRTFSILGVAIAIFLGFRNNAG